MVITKATSTTPQTQISSFFADLNTDLARLVISKVDTFSRTNALAGINKHWNGIVKENRNVDVARRLLGENAQKFDHTTLDKLGGELLFAHAHARLLLNNFADGLPIRPDEFQLLRNTMLKWAQFSSKPVPIAQMNLTRGEYKQLLADHSPSTITTAVNLLQGGEVGADVLDEECRALLTTTLLDGAKQFHEPEMTYVVCLLGYSISINAILLTDSLNKPFQEQNAKKRFELLEVFAVHGCEAAQSAILEIVRYPNNPLYAQMAKDGFDRELSIEERVTFIKNAGDKWPITKATWAEIIANGELTWADATREAKEKALKELAQENDAVRRGLLESIKNATLAQDYHEKQQSYQRLVELAKAGDIEAADVAFIVLSPRGTFPFIPISNTAEEEYARVQELYRLGSPRAANVFAEALFNNRYQASTGQSVELDRDEKARYDELLSMAQKGCSRAQSLCATLFGRPNADGVTREILAEFARCGSDDVVTQMVNWAFSNNKIDDATKKYFREQLMVLVKNGDQTVCKAIANKASTGLEPQQMRCLFDFYQALSDALR